MPPKVSVYCSLCKVKHARPVGRNCKRHQDVTSNVPEVSNTADPSTQASTSANSDVSSNSDVNHLILAQLTSMSQKLEAMDQRVLLNERTLAAQTSDARPPLSGPSTSSTVPTGPSVATAQPSPFLTESAKNSVVPSVEFVRSNPETQAQVELRIQELRAMNEQHMAGNLKSQRGGRV